MNTSRRGQRVKVNLKEDFGKRRRQGRSLLPSDLTLGSAWGEKSPLPRHCSRNPEHAQELRYCLEAIYPSFLQELSSLAPKIFLQIYYKHITQGLFSMNTACQFYNILLSPTKALGPHKSGRRLVCISSLVVLGKAPARIFDEQDMDTHQ